MSKKKKKKQENSLPPTPPLSPSSSQSNSLPPAKCFQCQGDFKEKDADGTPLYWWNRKDKDKKYCSRKCLRDYQGINETEIKNEIKNENKKTKEELFKEESERFTHAQNVQALITGLQSLVNNKKNDNNSTSANANEKPNENPVIIENETRLLLEKTKALEEVNKESIKVFNKEILESLEWLKQAQENNTLAYQVVNGKNQRIDKILKEFQQLEESIQQLKRQQKDNKFSDYIPWLIGGVIITFLVVIWLVIKNKRKTKKAKKI